MLLFRNTLLYKAPVIADLFCLKVSVLLLVLVIVIDRMTIHTGNASPALMKADYAHEHEHEHENAYDWNFIENLIYKNHRSEATPP